MGCEGFGTVYLVQSDSLGDVAIKEVESLTDKMDRKSFINEPDKIQLARQLADGMSYLHDIDIMYRNLYTADILIYKDVKISDFGLPKNLNTMAVTTTSKDFYRVIPFIDPCILENKTKVPISISHSKLFKVHEKPIIGIHVQYITIYLKCWDYKPDKCPSMTKNFQQLNSLELDPKYDDTA
ncbi:6317_t:CDS:2 [Cetraspora pellucida]|uniref:6317_t:CDS:1 n=1 Tax=Cetraspora pellucida TaxID=1433469 RepID=A0A9N9HHU1_9GLOM|nr:6317_t:CDS:2 [Cetraspora pellucida]